MGHARSRVLTEIKQVLTNLPTTGTNVFEDPASAVSESSLPAVIIESSREAAGALGETMKRNEPHVQSRILSIVVTAVAKSIAQRDQSAVEIEQAIMNSTVGNTRKIESTDFDQTGEGQARLWVCAISFDIQYLTLNTYPRVIHR